MLTTHPLLVPRLRKKGVIPPLPLSAFHGVQRVNFTLHLLVWSGLLSCVRTLTHYVPCHFVVKAVVRPLLEEGTDCVARLRNTGRIGVGKLGEDVHGNLNKQREVGVHKC
jgi:hypothetical protein